jgi:hypothetical protein
LDAEDLATVDADDEIVGDEGSKESGDGAFPGRWGTTTAMNWKMMILQARVTSPTHVGGRRSKRQPAEALVVPSAKLQFWRCEQRLVRQGKTV